MKIQFLVQKKRIVSIAEVIFFYLSSAAVSAQWNASILQKGILKNKDTVSTIIKYKIKVITTLTYKSDDSTLNLARLDSKKISTYNHAGFETNLILENGQGKTIEKTEQTYDPKNNLTESVSYDSVNNITIRLKFFYDNLNREVESSSLEPLSNHTGRPADENKYVIYSYKKKYDSNGNVIEDTGDSSGVIISRYVYEFDAKNNKTKFEQYNQSGVMVSSSVSKYDAKNRITNFDEYDQKALTSTVVYTYDSKGSTSTTELYHTPGRVECSPNKRSTVSKFDHRGNLVSTITTSEENGTVSISKTTSEYKYLNDKLLSGKTVKEIKGEGYSSKSTNQASFKYDASGNEIEAVNKYGGGGGSTTKRLKYNSSNSVIERVFYAGSCIDKPTNISTYIYYPDGITFKEGRYDTFDNPSKSVSKFDERALTLESFYTSPAESNHIVYQYEYWSVE